MAYQYRGKIRDVEPEPLVGTKAKCGTPSGYVTHRAHGTTPCRDCKDAVAAYHRKRLRKKRTIMRQTCATYAGYMRHKRNNEEPCDYCRPAYAQYMRDYREQKRHAA
jgi:hypothetical protein